MDDVVIEGTRQQGSTSGMSPAEQQLLIMARPAMVGIAAGFGMSAYGIYKGNQLVQSLSSKPTINFQTTHYASRLEADGVNVNTAQTDVQAVIDNMAGSLEVNAPVSGRLEVDGVLVEWRAYMLKDGTVNVGSIFPVK
ncbi:hypothetical protein AAKU58_004382 [Oxalobacteraceae bacterium GrIS 1.18]